MQTMNGQMSKAETSDKSLEDIITKMSSIQPGRLDCNAVVYHAFKAIADAPQEMLYAIALDSENNAIGAPILVTVGLVNQTHAHPREAFRKVVERGAVSVVFAHNHPSGNPEPSKADIAVTEQLRQAGEVLRIKVRCHIIITRDFYQLVPMSGGWRDVVRSSPASRIRPCNMRALRAFSPAFIRGLAL